MKKPFLLIAMLLQPEGNYTDEETIIDFQNISNGIADIDYFADKYAVNSDNIMEFDSIADYVIDEDADGVYLYKRIYENE